MTVLALFSGQAGTVLCADSQETAGGYAKRRVEKIAIGETDGFRVAIGAAGAGHYADMLAFELRHSLPQECDTDSDPEKIIQFIQKKLLTFHEAHGLSRGAEYALIELLIVIQEKQASGLPLVLHTLETAVNVIGWGTKCIGVGGYLADFILDHTLTGFGSRESLITAAAYMLREVIDNVEGCHDPSIVYLFRHDGVMEAIPDGYIKRLQANTETLIEKFRDLFHFVTDIDHRHTGMDEDLRELQASYRKALVDYEEEAEYWRNWEPKSKMD